MTINDAMNLTGQRQWDYIKQMLEDTREETKQKMIEDEIKFLEKLDNVWAEQEDKKGENVELDRIHAIICKKYDKLKTEVSK